MDELKLGIERFNAGRFEEALRLFRAARPAGPEARVFAGHALDALDRPEEALSAFVAAAEGFPLHAPAYDGLGALALRRAARLGGAGWRRLLAMKPRAPAARRLLAGALSSCAQGFLAAGRPDAAEAALRRLLALRPRDPGPRRRLIELFRMRAQESATAGDLPAAEESLRRALALSPADEESRRLLAGHLRLRAHALTAELKLAPAERALREAVSVAPRDARSRRRLGELLHQRGLDHQTGGRMDAAEKSLRAALALRPGDAKSRHRLLELLRARARALADGGRPDLAERTLRRALAFEPKDKEARRGLLELLRAPGDERALRRALAFEPGDNESRRLLVELLRSRVEEALAADAPAKTAVAARAALAFSRNDREVRLRLAELLRARGLDALFARRLARAEALFRLVLRCDPGDPSACLSLASAAAAAGRGAAEKAWLRRAAALARRRGALGEEFKALMKLRRGKEAVAAAERILDRRPGLDDLRCFWDPWEWDERAPREELLRELAAFERSLGPKPRGPWLHYYRGFLSGPAGLAHFERLEAFPAKRYAWMWFRAASAALLAGEFERAAVWFERCLAGEPADWRAHCFLAEAYLCLGRRADAFAGMDRALKAAPESEAGQVLAWRGAFELWLGRYEEALALLDRAAALGAQCAFCWRGAALLKLGRPEEALAELDRTLSLFPLDFEAYVWRGEAKRALGRPREALEDLDERAAKDRDLATPVWLWARFNRALAKAALGDAAGMDAEFAAIPAAVVDHLRARTGLERTEDLLEAGLRLSRGFRRDEYGQAIWMRNGA
ncbi:MAG: tetratricopeptide repeat protein [Elusimicrobia bacterium]|nr:tetratricopeptide repeat protein [Elusimicrobiota bacterium]